MRRAPSLILALLNLLLVGALAAAPVVIAARFEHLLSWPESRIVALATSLLLITYWALAGMPIATIGVAAFDLRRGRVRQSLWAGGISFAILLTAVLGRVFAGSFVSHQERLASAAWSRALDPIETVPARYPDAPDSQGALTLEAAAARIGIDLIPYGQKGARPRESDRQEYEAAQRTLREYATAQVDKPDDVSAAPPEEVGRWLSAHQSGVADLVTQVVRAGPILLETEWSKTYDPPLPNILGLRNVQSVLVTYALQHRANDSKAALEAVEASWKIGGALRNRGELVCQLLSTLLDGMTLAVLRKVDDVPLTWAARIGEHDYRMSMLRAFEADTWQFSEDQRRLTTAKRYTSLLARWLWPPIEEPYLRLSVSEYSRALADAVAELRRADPCSLDLAALDRRTERSIGRWNAFGRMKVPSIERAWRTAVRTALEVELTQKVLTARELKRNQGEWPSELTGLESAVCRGARWEYSRDGGVSLTLSGGPHLETPVSFRSAASR